MRLRPTLSLIALALMAPVQLLAQSDHNHAPPETLGTVDFTTSCNAAAQPLFNRAVALMHSFQFAIAIQGFQSTLAADPSCTISYWGVALSNWGNPFAAGIKPQAQLDRGLKAIQQATANAPKTPRERAYIEAVAHLFTNTASIDQPSRKLAYETAMASVAATYPQDVEASIFYALALAAAADPADKTYAKQLKAGAILENLFAQYPNHPGLAHYIIHTYDVPPLASRALIAAHRYSEIAPSSPHALHMPSHTFTRVGDWQNSIKANLAAAASARSVGDPAEELHATDYLVYAYLQIAQDEAAHHLVESSIQIFSHFDPTILISGAASPAAAYFAHAAIPARYCLERHAWTEAANLAPPAGPVPYADAITYFAKGLGAAHIKDVATARASIASLEKIRDQLIKSKEPYWANQTEIQRQEVSAQLSFAQGNHDSAITAMRAVAELEDKTEKNAVTPGPLTPARELLGELLLETNHPDQALKEFEATLIKEPNRFRALYGAAEAAKLSSDQEKARSHFQKLLSIADHPDNPERPELTEARTYISKQ